MVILTAIDDITGQMYYKLLPRSFRIPALFQIERYEEHQQLAF
jgi:hypothetical protein